MLIPFKASEATAAAVPEPSGAVEAGYTLLDVSFKVQGTITASQPPATRAPTAPRPAAVVGTPPAAEQTKGPTGKPGSAASAAAKGRRRHGTGHGSRGATARGAPGHRAGRGRTNHEVRRQTPRLPILGNDQDRPTQPPASESAMIDVEFHFPVEGDIYISVKAVDVPYKDGSYVISSEMLTRLARDLLRKVDAAGKLTGRDASRS